MPGPYIHISAMKHSASRLATGFSPPESGRIPQTNIPGVDPVELARLLDEHPNFGALGAIGPDLFFFLPDFRDVKVGGVEVNLSSVLVGVLQFLTDMYDMLDPFISKYEKYLGPISENLEEEVSRLTGGLSTAVSDVLGELKAVLITLVEKLLTHEVAFFDFFSLGHNKGYDNKAFLWSDMLHYRKTGAFGQALWSGAVASGDEGLKAYALGYLTHMATDVTGHAMVNTIAGGPFRLHWQRHHLVENHIDALWCLNDPFKPGMTGQYGQLTESALYFDIAFDEMEAPATRPAYPTGNTLRDRYVRRRVLDIDSDLPPSIAELLISAMEAVYYVDDELHPQILRDDDGKPNIVLIEQTYGLLFKFMKMTTTDGFGHERPMPPDVFPNLDFPVWDDPGGSPGDDDGDGSFWDDLLDFLLSIIKVIAYIFEVALWLASLPWAVLADMVTYPIRLGIYYALELPLFHLFKSVRSALVMTGYVVPMDDEIVTGLTRVGFPDTVAFDELKALMDDVFGGIATDEILDMTTTWRDPSYPRLQVPQEYRTPWLYPTTDPELPSIALGRTDRKDPAKHHMMTAGPHARGENVDKLFDMVLGDPNLRDAFESARTPGEADAAGTKVTPTQHLGDAVSFSEYLIWLATRSPDDGHVATHVQPHAPPLVDWNLDADRGYGYHCWDWNRSDDRNSGDGDDFFQIVVPPYFEPCRPPSQDDRFDPNVPVLLHWTSDDDPGCSDDAALPVMLDGPEEG